LVFLLTKVIHAGCKKNNNNIREICNIATEKSSVFSLSALQEKTKTKMKKSTNRFV
jgi:hypothetical protein